MTVEVIAKRVGASWVGRHVLRAPYRFYRRCVRSLFRRYTRFLDPHLISHQSLHEAMAARASYARGLLLDVGCGGEPYREMFSQVRRYIGVDLPSNGRQDVHGDGQALPFRSDSFDTVLCNQVLEHVAEPTDLMREAARVLRAGGILILTTPQTWGLHLEPFDFYRFTKYGLRHQGAKSGLEVLDVSPTCGLWATCGQRIADTVIFTYAAGRSRLVLEPLMLAMAVLLHVACWLDHICGKRGDTLDYVMVARKPLSARA